MLCLPLVPMPPKLPDRVRPGRTRRRGPARPPAAEQRVDQDPAEDRAAEAGPEAAAVDNRTVVGVTEARRRPARPASAPAGRARPRAVLRRGRPPGRRGSRRSPAGSAGALRPAGCRAAAPTPPRLVVMKSSAAVIELRATSIAWSSTARARSWRARSSRALASEWSSSAPASSTCRSAASGSNGRFAASCARAAAATACARPRWRPGHRQSGRAGQWPRRCRCQSRAMPSGARMPPG